MRHFLHYLGQHWINALSFAVSVVILFGSIGVVSAARSWLLQPKSATGGVWSPVGLPGTTIHSVVVGRGHRQLAFAGTENGVYRRSIDGSWRRVLSDGAVWSVALARDNHTVVAGDQGGDVIISGDAGNHWRHIPLTPSGVYAVITQPNFSQHLIAGAGDGLYRSLDGGRHWRRRLALRQSAGTAFAWAPGSGRVVFAGTVASSASGSTDVYVSRDAGMTWQIFGTGLNSGGGIMSLAINSEGATFAGTMGHATWKAPLSTRVWRQVANGMPPINDHVASIAIVPGTPGTVLVGTLGQGVFTSTDSGKHWVATSSGLPTGDSGSIVLSLAYSPAEHVVYAGTTSGIYRMRIVARSGRNRTATAKTPPGQGRPGSSQCGCGHALARRVLPAPSAPAWRR